MKTGLSLAVMSLKWDDSTNDESVALITMCGSVRCTPGRTAIRVTSQTPIPFNFSVKVKEETKIEKLMS